MFFATAPQISVRLPTSKPGLGNNPLNFEFCYGSGGGCVTGSSRPIVLWIVIVVLFEKHPWESFLRYETDKIEIGKETV